MLVGDLGGQPPLPPTRTLPQAIVSEVNEQRALHGFVAATASVPFHDAPNGAVRVSDLDRVIVSGARYYTKPPQLIFSG